MSGLPTRSHAGIVATIAAGMQGRVVTRFLNFAAGRIFLALAEAYAGVCLWLQREITQVQRETRLATSFGSDVDSFVADFDLARLPAIAATGAVTFTRFTASNSEALVPIGATVRTGDGSLTYVVTADTDLASFDVDQGGYVVPGTVAQISVPVACTTLGSVGNVGIGAINLIASEVRGLDAVINLEPFSNGLDAESDEAVKSRFKLFFPSLSKATEVAIRRAVASLQQGLQCEVVENKNLSGTDNFGFFYVVIDDGTGNPPDSVLEAVRLAIEAVRGNTIRFAVYRPQVTWAELSAVITAKPGYALPQVIAAVARAWDLAVNSLRLGEPLRYGRLFQLAYDASPGVASVQGLTINGDVSDVGGGARQTVRTQQIYLS